MHRIRYRRYKSEKDLLRNHITVYFIKRVVLRGQGGKIRWLILFLEPQNAVVLGSKILNN